MRGKVFALILITVFIFSSYVFAEGDYQEELANQKVKAEELKKEIKELKKDLSKVEKDYINADMQLRKDILAEKKKIAKTEKQEDGAKAIVRESKNRQKELQKGYYEKKKPISAQMHSLKVALNKAIRQIRKLENKFKKMKEGYVDDEGYKNKIKKLKDEIAAAKNKLNQAITELKAGAKQKLDNILNKEDKASLRKTILSEAKNKEIELRKQFNVQRAAIKEKIAQIKKERSEFVKKQRQLIAEKRKNELEKQQVDVAKEKEKVTGRKQGKQNFSS